MLYALVVAIVAAAVLIFILMRRGARGGRGDLLGPPPGLGARSRPAPPPAPASPAGGEWPDGAAPVVDLRGPAVAAARRLVAQGQKLEAIKLIREANPGWSLGQAKEWVERL